MSENARRSCVVLAVALTLTMPAVPSATAGDRILLEAGTTVTARADGTMLMLGDTTLARLSKGTELAAVQNVVFGSGKFPWVGCRVVVDGNQLIGWVNISQVHKPGCGEIPFIGLMARMTSVSDQIEDAALAEDVRSWKKTLDSKTGREIDGTAFVFNLASNLTWLYKDDQFKPSLLRQYARRTEQTPDRAISRFQDALNTASGETTDRLNTLLLIIRTDTLSERDAFDEQQFTELVRRLNVIPREAVSQWANVTDAEKDIAAWRLVGDDSLFHEGSFNSERFQEELKEEKRFQEFFESWCGR